MKQSITFFLRSQRPFLLGAIVCILAFGTARAETWKLYYLGGQSNMDGYGYIKDLPADLNTPMKGVMIFHGNTAKDGDPIDGKGVWSVLKPGHGVGFASDGVINAYSNRFGLELTFAKRLRALDQESNIAIIKYSRGGTSIDKEAAGNFGCWEPDFSQNNGVNQYDHFLATVRNAMAVRDIDGDGQEDTLIPSGILWMQGESDTAYTQAIAERYEANLRRLMNLIRAAFRMDDIPAVIGRISDSGRNESGKVWKFGEIVRQAQADFVKEDGFAALVTETDNYQYSDPWHYDSAGYIDLGKRFAETLHSLLLKRRGN